MAAAPLLRVPPFPGARVDSIAGQGEAIGGDVRPLLDALRAARVGGSFWAAQPALPAGALILKPASRAQATDMLARAAGTARPVVLWLAGDDAARGLNSGDALVVSGDWSFGKGVQVKGSAKLEGAHGRVEAGAVLGEGTTSE